jgi:hypothetical protein
VGAPTFAHPYLLPFEAVVASGHGRGTLAEAVEKVSEDAPTGWGPIRDADPALRHLVEPAD